MLEIKFSRTGPEGQHPEWLHWYISGFGVGKEGMNEWDRLENSPVMAFFQHCVDMPYIITTSFKV